ncbi:MmgE/PrpD family protein [Bosea sp. (in: a-proteobacteria)]|uniref:MmgE/PrpD family protein n=1 Tax=Bosea sp. (in: a-proteobacteria) TaxID=1871050 RepID=UPI00262AEE56|nr:MmgE/PrpD family protein [Bosea sp. (in: a-proteobacteria)]MCO5091853.1 MmgE/PrpD family protein [Bosea sp. (in: a-proteobacteria)]
MTLSQTLAATYAKLTADALPAETVHAVRRHLLDTLGAALAGARQPETNIAAAAAKAILGGAGQARLWGRGERLSVGGAALANGVAAHALELDDASGCDHSGAVVVPAVLAALEALPERVDDGDLIAAICAGYDLGRRMLEAAGGYDAHNGAGWHSTGTCGAFGATAAVARLRGLDEATMAQAFGIAGSMSAGNWSFLMDGAMTKRLHCGLPALAGNLAVELALQGFTGPAKVFEADWGGFFRTYAPATAQPEMLLRELGKDWRIHNSSIKPFASCRGTHSAIEIMLALAPEVGADAIAEVEVGTNAVVARMCGNQDIRNLVDAQMSIPYSVAVAWRRGAADLAAFDEDVRAAADVRDAVGRIRVVHDEAVKTGIAARLRAVLADGRVVERRIDVPLGSPGNLLPDAGIERKYRDLVRPVLGEARTEELAQRIWKLSPGGDARDIVAFL